MQRSAFRVLPATAGLICLIGGTAAVSGAGRQDQAAQTFRTTTDVVTIDVHVRTGGETVAGLSAEDFVLVDNGVRQDVEIVALEAVPIDVSILIDTGADVVDDISGMADHVRQIAGLVRPQDSVRVMGVGPYVRDLVPAAPNVDLAQWPTPATDGPTAAFDGLAAALLRPIGLDRRHLIIAIMNGIDGVSALPVDALHDVARRSGAMLYVAAVDLADPPGWTGGRQRLDNYRCRASKVCEPIRDFWVPYHEHRFQDLEAVATISGGKYYYPSLFTVATATAVFRRAFEDYRQNYLLRYSPRGVDREGWHEVEVTIPAYPGYEIRARRGYAIDRAGSADTTAADGAAPPATASASASAPPADIDGIVAAYERRDYGLAFAALRASANPRALIGAYLERSAPWPDNPRREAVFALELAQAGLRAPRGLGVSAARNLLATHATLVRHPVEPDAFERYWLWASLAIALNVADRTASTMAAAAMERFPDEPRFVLARAVSADQSLRAALANLAPGERPAARTIEDIDEVLSRYDAAIARPGTRHEATVRKAWVLHRLERHVEALALLNAAGDAPTDATMTFIRHLFRGRTLDGLGRIDEAAAAFRAALDLAPAAQSAQVSLMTALLRLGDREGATALAEAVQATDTAVDPWWMYWPGDYRFFPGIIERLRAESETMLPPVSVPAGATGSAPSQAAPPSGLNQMLDRYLAGEYASVNAELRALDDFDALLDALRAEGVAWTEAGGPDDVARRTLAAATFALEAAGWAEQVMDWKWVQRIDLSPPAGVPTIARQTYQPEDAIWWKAPPLLIAWGCELLRQAGEPSEAERLWHLASVAVADRAGDYEFLIGSVWDERGNPGDEFEHLDHAKARFPDEPRFELAEAIAVEFRTWSIGARRTRTSARNLNDAEEIFGTLVDRDAIGAEAMIRLGVVRYRARRYGDAIEWLERGERVTREPYLLYLAKYFRGKALEADDRQDEAEQAYRDALRVIPRAQSATMALAAVLARTDRPLEASELVEASLTEPIVRDPWREYGAADDRFWPYLIGRLHEEIQRGRIVAGAGR